MLSIEKRQQEHKWQQSLKLSVVVDNNIWFEVLISLSRISQISVSCFMPTLSLFFINQSLLCKWVKLNALSIFNAMLRIRYVVNTNVFHTLPLFKSKCCPLKLVGVLMYGWHITRKVKLVAKKKVKQAQQWAVAGRLDRLISTSE